MEFLAFLYWIIGAFFVLLLCIAIPRAIYNSKKNDSIRKRIDPNAINLGSPASNFFINQYKHTVSFVPANSKVALQLSGSRITNISEISGIKTGEGKEQRISYYLLGVSFKDGLSVDIEFNSEREAVSARAKLDALKAESVTDEHQEIDVSNEVNEFEDKKTTSRVMVILAGLGILFVGHMFMFFESNAEKREKEALAKEYERQRVEKYCSEPSNAISFSRQIIRENTVGSIDFIRSSDMGRLIGECTFKVYGEIEGTNRFGGLVRNYYVIKMYGKKIGNRVSWRASAPVISHDRDAIFTEYLRD